MAIKKLPIKKIVFYKHGVGFFERAGEISGKKSLKLSFKKKDMNDILKSLIVFDRHPAGKVVTISYDTQEDVEQIIREKSINLDSSASLTGLLRVLRGYDVTLKIRGENIRGTVVGIDYSETRKNFSDNFLSLYVSEEKKVLNYSLSDIGELEINDEVADGDLKFFLEKSIAERKKDERFVTVILDGEDHDLLINYIASAPTWRVSYRLVYQNEDRKCLFMGWGIVNNTLEEDLEDVKLVLTTGMPISFIYDLYTPKILERPEVKDESRALAKPAVFEEARMARSAPARARMMSVAQMAAPQESMSMDYFAEPECEAPPMGFGGMGGLAEKTTIGATGEKEGQFFKYNISTPVTIKRGQSAMVPILSLNFDCSKEHVYTARKGEKNPYVTLSFKNESSYIFERGPVTVIEDGSYVGEAIVPFVSKEQQVRLPYALDVEVKVKEEFTNRDEFRSLYFSKNPPGNYLFYREVYNIAEAFYSANNSSDTDVNLVIEHKPSGTAYEVFDPPEYLEKTENYLRWKITVPAGGSETLRVKERIKLYRNEYYNNLTMDTLSWWLKERYLDEETFDDLKGIYRLFDKIRDLEKDSRELEEERRIILEDQKNQREQLKVLGEKGDEAILRKRYVDNMKKQEDRLEEIAKEKFNLSQKISRLRQDIDKAIEDLCLKKKK